MFIRQTCSEPEFINNISMFLSICSKTHKRKNVIRQGHEKQENPRGFLGLGSLICKVCLQLCTLDEKGGPLKSLGNT